MPVDRTLLGLLAKMVLINIVPFFLVFHLVMRRRKQLQGENFSELRLIAGEIQVVGLLGYFVILSIYFFSIPVLQYMKERDGYDILLVEPDGLTVFLIALISFKLVFASIYLRVKRLWAYRLLVFVMNMLVLYSFFNVLDLGFAAIVPLVLFSYLLYRLTRRSLMNELLSPSKT